MALARLRFPAACVRLVRLHRALGSSAEPGQHQTPIVDQLWKRRQEAKQKRDEELQRAVAGESPAERTLITKTPEDSASSITYEFSKPENGALTDRYRNPWGLFRVGRLLEDLDALAGTIAFDHCKSPNPLDEDLHIVTASVDRIKYMHRPSVKDDIHMCGQVTFVGRSSMEISMQARCSWSDQLFMESNFTFVARDPKTNKATEINSLRVTTPEEKMRFELGRQRDAARKARRNKSKANILGRALDEEGIAAARELLREGTILRTMPTLADTGEVLMQETVLQNTLTAMPQHRNTAGRIFGGFLMRRAYELAHATAYVFGGRKPVFMELDEVLFRSPVSVGDLLRLDSSVLYTSENVDPKGRATIHVEVIANVLVPEKRQAVTSNIFNFTFGLSDGHGAAMLGKDIELRRVVPSTFEEACRVIERYQGDLEQVEEEMAMTRASSAPPEAGGR